MVSRYIAIAVLIALIVCFAAVGYFKLVADRERAEKEAAIVRLIAVEEANRENTETIKRITEMRVYNEALLTELVKQVNDLHKEAAATSAAINDLEKANADVKAYLERAIPDDLRKLLTNRPGGAIQNR